MIRRHLTFACEGVVLAGTLDREAASHSAGLLIVSGGNEVRSGAWSGQAQLAARLASEGFPVFRYDRRGIGDSEGENLSFRHSGPDIAAAIAAFRAAAPHLSTIVAFGNCDAAAALMLNAGDLALDGLVLANPWTIDGEEASPSPLPAAAIRSRYLSKLANPREVWRLLTGGVNLGKLARGLRSAAAPASPASGLVQEMKSGLNGFDGPVSILLASRDRTAQMFSETWDKADPRIQRIDSASHSFSDEAAREWLHARLVEALTR